MLLVNDRALLDGFRAGRPSSLKIVYMHYQPRVAGFLRSGFTFNSGDRYLRFKGYSRPFELETAARGLQMSRIRLRRIEQKLKRRLLGYLQANGYLASVSPAILGAGLRSVLF